MNEDKKFERTHVHDVMVKRIILRLDFAGVIDSNELVKVFDKNFPKSFKRRNLIINNELNVTLHQSDLDEIGKTLSIPVSVIQKSHVTRYIGLTKKVACDVTLDISQYYLCMLIECNNNYDGLDNYTEVFKGAITLFREKIQYFRPRRLGLRKIREQHATTKEDAKSPFEPFVFPENSFAINNYQLTKSEFIDCIMSNDERLKFNIHRRLEKMQSEDKNTIYVSLLDLDTYCDDEVELSKDLNELLRNANEKEFRMYESCMTRKYLESISN